MSSPLSDADLRALAKIRMRESGVGSVDIAKASLGTKARKHSLASLDLIGFAIASRLVGQHVIVPRKANKYRLA